jgi:hypothetical protein
MDFLAILNGIAAVVTVVAAVLVASNYSPRTMVVGFSTFVVASVLWMIAGYIDAKLSLVFQNAVLLVVNVVGIWRWLPKPG